MSAPSNSPNQEQTSHPIEPDKDHDQQTQQNPVLISQNQETPQVILEEKNQENHSLIPQNQETPQVILEEKDPHHKTIDSSSHSSLSVLLPPVDDNNNNVVSVPLLMSPTNHYKRKKRKCSTKKMQAFEKRLQTLKENIKLVPFEPSKILDFPRHEKLLRRLGLWDFVNIEFDRDLRVDLVSQLIASYDPKLRCSYVNEFRVAVNRTDLGRALKLPVKKGGVEGVGSDDDPMTEESRSFLESFVSIWVLLHLDTWIMPNEVINWTNAVKNGQPEKVDWAGLFWCMVENELMRGERLVDCYYAPHLQYLMKSQREQLFREEPEKVEFEGDPKEDNECDNEDDVGVGGASEGQEKDATLETIDDECNNEDNAGVGGSTEGQEKDATLEEFANIELTLGQDLGEKQEDVEMIDVEEHKDAEEGVMEKQWVFNERADANEPLFQRCKLLDEVSLDNDKEKKEEHQLAEEGVDDDDDEEAEEGAEEKQWSINERADANEPLVQRGKMLEEVSLDNDKEKKEDHEWAVVDSEEEEEDEEEGADEQEVEDGFDLMPSDDTFVGDGPDGLTGNLLQTMESTQIAFGSQGQLHVQPSVELLSSRAEMQTGGSFFGSGSKRELEIEHDAAHHSLNGSNKRLRIESSWDKKPLDFGSCMDQMQQLMMRARTLYEEKEQNEEQFNMNQQILLNEVTKRDTVIEHLHKSKYEEIQQRDRDISRLERELFVMGNILEGYRKALKQMSKQFSEYRQKFPLPEEPYYKDAGPGGLMLSTAEIEKRRLKQEEENRLTRLFLEQKAKEAEDGYATQFEDFVVKVRMLDERLMNLENKVKDLRNMTAKHKAPETEEKILETPVSPLKE